MLKLCLIFLAVVSLIFLPGLLMAWIGRDDKEDDNYHE